MAAPSGTQYVIDSGGYRAVVTESGAALRELTCRGRHLIDGFAEDQMASGGRGQVLMPWPNRIRDGRYRFGGTEQQLALTEPKRHNASHGLVRWAAWSLAEQQPDRVRLEYRLPAQTGYPWSVTMAIEYAVGVGGLLVTQSATNLSDTPAPYASGAHPYLLAGEGPCDEWRLTLPARTRLLTDPERLLPTGRAEVAGTPFDFREGHRIADLVINDAFTDLVRDGSSAVVRLESARGGVELAVDEHHRWLQLYTADDTSRPRVSLAVEPMTAPPDAFNSGDDLVVLEPGATFEARWSIRALPAPHLPSGA